MSSAMEYRFLGKTGLKVSALSFGSWVTFKNQVDVDEAYALIKHAYQAGINFFDNAEVYANGESERVMGEAFQKGFAEKVFERSDLVVCTKIFFGYKGDKKGPNDSGLSRKHLIEGAKASLKRLQLDYVDVLLCHRPDVTVPIKETVRTMNTLINQGLIYYWGTSEWTAEQIREAHEIAEREHLDGPICDQPQYNVFHRQRVEVDYKPLYREFSYGLTIWSPLASGILTGKYSGNVVPEGSRFSRQDMGWLKEKMIGDGVDIDRVGLTDKLMPIAEEVGCTMGQLAIAWCLSNKKVSTVILGATTLEQLKENLTAAEFASKITPEIKKKIDEIVGVPKEDGSVAQGMGVRGGYREQW